MAVAERSYSLWNPRHSGSMSLHISEVHAWEEKKALISAQVSVDENPHLL
jgi:hypothetical protein